MASETRTWSEPLVDDFGPEVPPTVAPEDERADVELGPIMDHDVTVSESFPQEWKNDFEGLLYLGYLEAEVTIPHHTFIVHTLLPGAKIELASMLVDMQTSIGYGLAYKCAVVSAALDSVDDRPIIVSSKRESSIRQKYQYVINAWYEPVIDLLYTKVEELEVRQDKLMRELGIIPDPARDL